jgi:drug/metabolite transporter (DMT)-like permease
VTLALSPFALWQHPVVRVLTGALLISFSAVWVKLAGVAPVSSAFYRLFFGSCFLVLFFLIRRERWSLNLRGLWLSLACGLLFVLDLLFWHAAIGRIGPGLATLVSNFQVFILALVGFFLFKERYAPTMLLGIPLAVFGLYLLIGPQWQELDRSYRTGIYLGLVTALCYAAYLLVLKKLSATSEGGFLPMLIISASGSLMLAGYFLYSGNSFALPDAKSVVSLLGLGLFSQCLGWYIIAGSMACLNVAFAGLVLLLQPLLSFVWDVLFFSRPTTMVHWCGVGLALLGIYLGLTAKRPKLK